MTERPSGDDPPGAAGRSPLVLAIDLGTGTAKVALVARDGTLAGWAMRPVATTQGPGGAAEQDPGEWWAAVCAASRDAVAAAGVREVLAVRCTSQWATTVPVDAAGDALTPAITWMDSRGGRHVRAVAGGPVAGYAPLKLRRWIALTGGAPVLSGIDGFGHAQWLRHERPEVWEATAALLEPGDYLGLRLTGNARGSFASVYPYWLTDNRDVAAIDYDEGLLRTAGIDRAKLPDLVPMDGTVGTLLAEAAAELGVAPGVPVLAGVPDLGAATVGAGAAAMGSGYFYVGTTSWLSCHVPRKRTDVRHQLGTMPAALPGRYVVVAEQGMAGRCLEWLQQTLIDEPYEELERMAASVTPGSDGLLFAPWLGGVAVPVEDGATRSAFFNQTWRTTRAHYVRAVMEGIALNVRWLRPHVERFARTRFAALTFIGGAAQSDTWSQLFADVLRVPIRRVAEPRLASAIGCGLLAFHALGELREDQLSVPIDREFVPGADAVAAYDRAADAFARFYTAARPVYRRLNR